MLLGSVLSGLAVLGTAAALPQQLEARHSERIHANFEDLPTIPLIPLLTPTGKYKSLDFTGFEVTPTGLGGLVITGLDAQSPPNVIASGLQAELLTGPAQIKTTGTTQSFDLESFYFGCVLNTAVSLLSVAPGCKLTVTGYDKQGNGHAQEFEFVGTGLKNPMKEAKLNDKFKNLVRVEFDTDTTLEILTATLYDSFTYTVHRQ